MAALSLENTSWLPIPFSVSFGQNFLNPENRSLVEPKTRTYHGRIGSERPAERLGGVGQDWVPTERLFVFINPFHARHVRSQTRTHHRRVASGRTAEWRGGVGQDCMPTELFAQETKVHRSVQGIEQASLQRLSRSTNKRNPM